ncbi:hypothetical protein HPP92_015187 [Vanilla planifolia]|uniref:GIR1-like zinc ribbon domain-containing protein n=1 Tax=Vanilla planifolia TaxID=51239 RepID=A0A835QQY9_VANPL|nr:hypothetical protein HPP92_015187 [Vanilla planifolia]
MQSGETYLHRVDPNPTRRGLQDLNLPPSLPEDSALLDLKLSGGGGSRGEYQSVCTLEKVRSALERAGRVSVDQLRRQVDTTSVSPSASPSSSMNSSSAKRKVETEDDDGGSNSNGGMMAAACPSCLLYVLISKKNPRCPRCDTRVPFPFIPKKTKIDLNSSAS